MDNPSRHDDLTPAERDVLRHLLGGRDESEIAARTGLPEEAVRPHVARILARHDVADPAEPADLARRTRRDAPSRLLDWMPEAGALTGRGRRGALTTMLGLAVIGVAIVVALNLLFGGG